MKNKIKIFVIYELTFSSSKSYYIGKTYDMNHRLKNHKYVAIKKNEKNHRANWIRKHINESPNIKILFTTKDEKEAYIKELEFIKLYLSQNKILVNTQRLKEAGGLSNVRILKKETLEKLRKRFGKKYILIDKNGKLYRATGLKYWAEQRKLNNKDLNAVAKNKFHMSQGYRVFYRDEWNDLNKNEKLKIINDFKSGEFEKKNKETNINLIKKRNEKKYIIIDKNFNIIKISNLDKFSKENNLNLGNMSNTVYKKNRVCNGYKAFLEEDFNNLSNTELNYYKELVNKYKNSKWNRS